MRYRDFTPEETKTFRKALVRMHNDLGKMYMLFLKDTKEIKHREFPALKKGLGDEFKSQRENLKSLIKMIDQKLLK
jgi:hypothetical protein